MEVVRLGACLVVLLAGDKTEHTTLKSIWGKLVISTRPPLWSSGQSFWLQVQRSRVRFLAIPDFLRSSGAGRGSTQPREDN
jgi:hypothetical protein